MGIWEDLLLCYKGTCTKIFFLVATSAHVMLCSPNYFLKKSSYNFITEDENVLRTLSIFLPDCYALLLASHFLH